MEEEIKQSEGPDKQEITGNQNSIWPSLRALDNVRTLVK